MSTAREAVEAYWLAAEERDWAGFAALVAADVLYEALQSRERVRSRDAYVRFNSEGFPGGWHQTVERIVAADREAVSLIRMRYPDGSEQPGLSIFDIGGDGLITRITDFWPDAYEPPASRAGLVERYE